MKNMKNYIYFFHSKTRTSKCLCSYAWKFVKNVLNTQDVPFEGLKALIDKENIEFLKIEIQFIQYVPNLVNFKDIFMKFIWSVHEVLHFYILYYICQCIQSFLDKNKKKCVS